MRKSFNTLLFLSFFAGITYSQDILNYDSQWQTRPNFGVNIPLTKLLDGHMIDNLFEYGDNSTYWQVLSVTYFFHKHFGVEVNVQGMTTTNLSKRAEVFREALKSEYEVNYYVTPSTGAIYNSFNLVSGNFERGFIGLICRYKKDRLFLYPKISIGVSSFYTDWGKAIIKQRNSNNVIEVGYSSGKRPNDHIIVAASTAFGYKLSNRFYLNLDLMNSYYRTNITFTKKTTDLYTNFSTTEYIEYNKNIFTLSMGGGLIYVIKQH